MKNKICFTSIFFLFLCWGCFEDEGNYDYKEVNAPEWNKDYNTIAMVFRAGEIAKFRSSPYFTWSGDSAQRAEEVTYEWKLENVVLSDKADFEMSTDELIKKIGLMKLDGKEKMGNFFIIEKNTGMTYTRPIRVQITPTNASGDWYVLSENGGNAKLSFIKRQRTEARLLIFELKEDVYPELNGGEILGKPLFMTYAEGATNIGDMGALTIVTTSEKYEINCENMVKVGNLEEVPIAGEIRDRYDSYSKTSGFGLQTFVVDAEGKMYRRMLTNNNLAGEFGTKPIVLDAKDYRISMFGKTQLGYVPIPCYDALNRRVLSILFYESGDAIFEEWFPGSGMGSWVPNGEQYKLSKLHPTGPAQGVMITGCAPVWDMPVGTKPLHMWHSRYDGHPFAGGNYDVMGLIYNDASGKTWLTEYGQDQKTGRTINGLNPFTGVSSNILVEFSGGNLQEGDCILASSHSAGKKVNFILYSKGNQIRYINRNQSFGDNAYITLEDITDKVTCMAWALKNGYAELIVGTEKGKVIFYDAPYDIPLSPNPRVINEFDLGGRVISLKELNNESFGGDKY